MAESRSRRFFGSSPTRAPEVQSVEWLPSDVGKVLVRVAGRWPTASARRPAAPVLIVDDGNRPHRFPALPETSQAAARAAGDKDSFRASFLVAQELTRH